MRDSRGLTLIEVLAVLVIIGVITILINSIFISGLKASDRGTTKQRLQQESNYIIEQIRKEYLKNDAEAVVIVVDNSNHTLKVNNRIISEGYTYYLNMDKQYVEIERTMDTQFHLKLEKNNNSFEIRANFTKLR